VNVFNKVIFDEQLIKRYDIPGPRYTSYPTAADFHERITKDDFFNALNISKQQHQDLSIYVHIPFCQNICYYCACNKVITKNKDVSDIYLKHLINEIKTVAKYLGKEQQVKQLHFGGGTPTFLNAQQLSLLINTLKTEFNFSDDDATNDFGIEIDPRTANWQMMGILRELGFNRVSFGVQDLNPAVQTAVNRVQSLEMIEQLVDAVHTLYFHSLNIDLIYGLPKQTPASFAQTVEQIIKLKPDRLSIFNYAHLPTRFKPQRRINADELPSSKDKLIILQNTIHMLLEAGYKYIGMDHFALPTDELSIAQEQGLLQRNFQGYSTHGNCDLLGFGASAISSIGNLYVQNFSNLDAYQAALTSGNLAIWRGIISNLDDQIRRYVIGEIMCHGFLDIELLNQTFNINFADYFHDELIELNDMFADGLLEINANYLNVLPAGKLLIRVIALPFDRYLKDKQDQHNKQLSRFSRII